MESSGERGNGLHFIEIYPAARPRCGKAAAGQEERLPWPISVLGDAQLSTFTEAGVQLLQPGLYQHIKVFLHH